MVDSTTPDPDDSPLTTIYHAQLEQISQQEEILVELRKLTAALERLSPLLDNPVTRWKMSRKS